jgi:hypothetical protein
MALVVEKVTAAVAALVGRLESLLFRGTVRPKLFPLAVVAGARRKWSRKGWW